MLKRGKAGGTVRGKAGAVAQAAPIEPVTITSKEISALLSGVEFGNHAFMVKFRDNRIQVLGNIPIPKQFTQALNDQQGEFQTLANFFGGGTVPFSAELGLSLDGGKVFAQLHSADIMGMPLSMVAGDTWEGWQRMDLLSGFSGQAPILEDILGQLERLRFDESGLHLTPR